MILYIHGENEASVLATEKEAVMNENVTEVLSAYHMDEYIYIRRITSVYNETYARQNYLKALLRLVCSSDAVLFLSESREIEDICHLTGIAVFHSIEDIIPVDTKEEAPRYCAGCHFSKDEPLVHGTCEHFHECKLYDNLNDAYQGV